MHAHLSTRIFVLIFLATISLPFAAIGSTLNSIDGRYVLHPLPEERAEAERMDRIFTLSSQVPIGRYVRKGDRLTIRAEGKREDEALSIHIGFQPMFGVELDQHTLQLKNGPTVLVSEQDGPVFLSLTTPAKTESHPVFVSVNGTQPLPFFVSGESTLSNWHEQISQYGEAPFVQLLSQRSIVTLPMDVYRQHPIDNPQASLSMIDKIIELQDELAGLDGVKNIDEPTPLRNHFLVDFRASKKNRELFYMYATSGFIGMKPDSIGDLVDPERLSKEWGIWHELGHTHQQASWTWESLSEISVNLFPLYIQEKLGIPSRLLSSESGENGATTIARADEYKMRQGKNYIQEASNYDEHFVKLVMFDELRRSYGWSLFTSIFKHFRSHPLPSEASEEDRVDAFILAACVISKDDLRPFFDRWGLYASTEGSKKIETLNLNARDALRSSRGQ